MLRSYPNYLLHQFSEEFNSNLFHPCLHNSVCTLPRHFLTRCDGFHKTMILIFPKILEKAGQSTELGLNDSVSGFCEAPVQCDAFTGRRMKSPFSSTPPASEYELMENRAREGKDICFHRPLNRHTWGNKTDVGFLKIIFTSQLR